MSIRFSLQDKNAFNLICDILKRIYDRCVIKRKCTLYFCDATINMSNLIMRCFLRNPIKKRYLWICRIKQNGWFFVIITCDIIFRINFNIIQINLSKLCPSKGRSKYGLYGFGSLIKLNCYLKPLVPFDAID